MNMFRQSGTKVLDTVPKITVSLFFIFAYILSPTPLIQCWNYHAVVPNCVSTLFVGCGGSDLGMVFFLVLTKAEHLLRKHNFAEMCQWFCP